MKEEFLPYFCCPNCQSDLSLSISEREGNEVKEGNMYCRSCDISFAIRNHIPRFIQSVRSDKIKTAQAFGYEWKEFNELSGHYRQQFLDWIHPITPDNFRDKIVLDAGCGKGRHMYWSQKFGAKMVFGIDLSDAVDVAYKNTKNFNNVCIIQADIYHLPLKPIFDFIYSIGVLHHLPYPASGFNSLVNKLKTSGQIAVWIYAREGNGWIVYAINPLRIFVTSKLSPTLTKYIAYVMTLVLYSVLRLIYKPVNRISLLKPLKKILFYNDYLSYISHFPFREVYSIVFDHLIAPTAYYIKKNEFESWFTKNNLQNAVITMHNNNSWRGSAKK